MNRTELARIANAVLHGCDATSGLYAADQETQAA
jgi:hypothetical protein